MTTIINGSSPSITFSDGSAQTSATRPFQNRIINGAMVISQRNGTSSVTGNDSVYGLDRWKASCVPDGKFTMQQSSTAPVGFINSMLVTSTSAYSVASSDFIGIRQDIEGLNCTDLGWGTADAKTVTLSFWVRSSLTGTFGGSIFNNAGNRSYPFSFTISSANTFEQKSVTIAGDTSGTWLTTNGRGLCLFFNLGSGATNSGTAGAWAGTFYAAPTGATSVVGTNGATFYITGVQLEVGSTATSFDYRPYGTELQLCQRYFEKSYDQSVVAGASSQFGSISAICCGNTNRAFSTVTFKVPKRATPTLTLYSTTGASGNFRNLSQSADMPISISGAGQCGESGAALLASSGIVSVTDTLIGQFTSSAEL